MTSPASVERPTGEDQRLRECVLEPIHLLAGVQPHGVLLTADLDSFEIRQVSTSSASVLGIEPSELLGSSLAALVGRASVDQLRDALDWEGRLANPLPVRIGEKVFDAIVHESGGVAIVELETADPTATEHLVPRVFAAMQRLGGARTIEDLRAWTVRELRQLTGFDRVLMHQFHSDGHGEIVAEMHSEDMESYLGLHYPASDIPVQARRLYLSKRSRTIANSSAVSASLVPPLDPTTGEELDLCSAELRSVSPHHLQFMRNMGQASTLSLSLIHDGVLAGMITLAHRTPRTVSFALRQGYEVLANQVSLQLTAMAEIEWLTRIDRLRTMRHQLMSQVAGADDLTLALLKSDITLLDFLPADGAALALNGQSVCIGTTPPDERMADLVAVLGSGRMQLPLATEAVATEHPDIASLIPGFAGVLVVPFGTGAGYLAWFRGEKVRKVAWLGDQTLANRDTPLSPRKSFSAWTVEVSGKAEPWDAVEVIEAVELAGDLTTALMRHAQVDRARRTRHDQLTGLPNGYALMERMATLSTREGMGKAIALLCIHLDRFRISDTLLGHDLGDAVIRLAAERLSSVTRAHDIVARIGGDEFMMLCEGTGATGAVAMAQRILAVLAEPIQLADRELFVTASIGIAIPSEHSAPGDLLRSADDAMYRARQQGRNRIEL